MGLQERGGVAVRGRFQRADRVGSHTAEAPLVKASQKGRVALVMRLPRRQHSRQPISGLTVDATHPEFESLAASVSVRVRQHSL
jgi:hypothetical protein